MADFFSFAVFASFAVETLIASHLTCSALNTFNAKHARSLLRSWNYGTAHGRQPG